MGARTRIGATAAACGGQLNVKSLTDSLGRCMGAEATTSPQNRLQTYVAGHRMGSVNACRCAPRTTLLTVPARRKPPRSCLAGHGACKARTRNCRCGPKGRAPRVSKGGGGRAEQAAGSCWALSGATHDAGLHGPCLRPRFLPPLTKPRGVKRNRSCVPFGQGVKHACGRIPALTGEPRFRRRPADGRQQPHRESLHQSHLLASGSDTNWRMVQPSCAAAATPSSSTGRSCSGTAKTIANLIFAVNPIWPRLL